MMLITYSWKMYVLRHPYPLCRSRDSNSALEPSLICLSRSRQQSRITMVKPMSVQGSPNTQPVLSVSQHGTKKTFLVYKPRSAFPVLSIPSGSGMFRDWAVDCRSRMMSRVQENWLLMLHGSRHSGEPKVINCIRR